MYQTKLCTLITILILSISCFKKSKKKSNMSNLLSLLLKSSSTQSYTLEAAGIKKVKIKFFNSMYKISNDFSFTMTSNTNNITKTIVKNHKLKKVGSKATNEAIVEMPLFELDKNSKVTITSDIKNIVNSKSSYTSQTQTLQVSLLNNIIGYLKGENADSGDNFGYSVTMSKNGDLVAIGIPKEDSNTNGINSDEKNDRKKDSGAVYIFKKDKDSKNWIKEAYIKANNSGEEDNFGHSVSLSTDGNTLAVGAPFEDNNAAIQNIQDTKNITDNNDSLNSGAVYIFKKVSGVWEKQYYIKSSNLAAGDEFGSSISLNGDGKILVSSSPSKDNSKGAAYVFIKTGGTWNQKVDNLLVPTVALQNNDKFGYSTSISEDGNYIFIGAPNQDAKKGKVHIFSTKDTWADRSVQQSSNKDKNDQFGSSVKTNYNGSILVVGAPFEDSSDEKTKSDNTKLDSGAAYIFTRNGTVWTETKYLKPKHISPNDNFGFAVSIDNGGNKIIISSPNEDSSSIGLQGIQNNDSSINSGAVYMYTKTQNNWTPSIYLKSGNTGAGDLFGSSLAIGSTTIAISSPFEDGNSKVSSYQKKISNNDLNPDSGSVYLY